MHALQPIVERAVVLADAIPRRKGEKVHRPVEVAVPYQPQWVVPHAGPAGRYLDGWPRALEVAPLLVIDTSIPPGHGGEVAERVEILQLEPSGGGESVELDQLAPWRPKIPESPSPEVAGWTVRKTLTPSGVDM